MALSAGQYLRIAIRAGRLDAFRARLGFRVWVDLEAWRVQLDEPTVADRA